MQNWTLKIIAVARRRLFHTRLAKTRLAAWVYAKLFELGAPDLNQPITFRGVSLHVDPRDRATVPAMVGGYYEQIELDIFLGLVNEADVFLDVGANVGLYSVLGCLRAPRLLSYAFEPILENQQLLNRNIRAHELADRVHVVPQAVSNRTGSVTMYLNHSATHSIHERGSDADQREVQTVSLDEFTDHAGVVPDVVKIDVEGHERAVIEGAMRTLQASGATIFVEYIPAAHDNVEPLVERLAALSPTCFVVDEISGDVREIRTSDLDRGTGSNLVLARREEHADLIRRVARP